MSAAERGESVQGKGDYLPDDHNILKQALVEHRQVKEILLIFPRDLVAAEEGPYLRALLATAPLYLLHSAFH